MEVVEVSKTKRLYFTTTIITTQYYRSKRAISDWPFKKVMDIYDNLKWTTKNVVQKIHSTASSVS